MDGSEMKIFPLVRATTRGRPYGVRKTHRNSGQINQKQRQKVPQGSQKGKKGRGSTRERGGADGRQRNEKFPNGSGDHTGSPLRHRENAQKKRANWPKTAAQNTTGLPQNASEARFVGKRRPRTKRRSFSFWKSEQFGRGSTMEVDER